MRRSGVLTGIGNSDPELMNGKSTGNPKLDKVINQCSKDCYKTFFEGTQMDYGGVDAGVEGSYVKIGIEPAYFGDNLRIIEFSPKKENCYYQTGHAFGYYGSGVRSKVRWYHQYKNSSKFTRFIDKWHSTLFLSNTPTKDL